MNWLDSAYPQQQRSSAGSIRSPPVRHHLLDYIALSIALFLIHLSFITASTIRGYPQQQQGGYYPPQGGPPPQGYAPQGQPGYGYQQQPVSPTRLVKHMDVVLRNVCFSQVYVQPQQQKKGGGGGTGCLACLAGACLWSVTTIYRLTFGTYGFPFLVLPLTAMCCHYFVAPHSCCAEEALCDCLF